MKGLKAGIAITLAVVAVPALADGGSLLSECQSNVRLQGHPPAHTEIELIQSGECTGMIRAVIQQSDVVNKVVQKKLCLPDPPISSGQAARIVLKYLDDHPKILDFPDSILVFVALQDAFPCK